MADSLTNATELVNKYVQSLGLPIESVFNKEKNAWYWVKGSAKIEVFIQSLPVGSSQRHFLRLFSPLVKIPQDKALAFYRRLLELNDTSLGVKITVMKDSDQIYATYERDIKGLDYDEVIDMVADFEWWSDHFDDLLMNEFGAVK
jgi:hypothetical protein